jgi:ParB/RepB/Spo0J family partition protein
MPRKKKSSEPANPDDVSGGFTAIAAPEPNAPSDVDAAMAREVAAEQQKWKASLAELPIALIQPNAYNPNKMKPDKVARLDHSVAQRGYVQPILVRKLPGQDKYEIVDGEHRFESFKRAFPDVENITCEVYPEDYPITEQMMSTIALNNLRGEPNKVRLAALVQQLVERGETLPNIEAMTGIRENALMTMQELGREADPVIPSEEDAPKVDREDDRKPKVKNESQFLRLTFAFESREVDILIERLNHAVETHEFFDEAPGNEARQRGLALLALLEI